MKKIKLLLILILFIIHYSSFITPVFAQREVEDYLYQSEKYRQIYTEFVSARDKFLKYTSLSSKKEAEKLTWQMLAQRAETLRTYMLALRYKLRSTLGVVAIKDKAGLSSSLDRESIWLAAHKKEIEQIDNPTLDELFEISDRLEDKNSDLMTLSYETLAAVLLGKERDLQSQSVSIANLLNDRIDQVALATQTAVLRQWLEEVKNKNYFSQKKIETSEEELSNLKKTNSARQLLKSFNLIQKNLEDSKYFLNQALSYQKEIFEKLKDYE